MAVKYQKFRENTLLILIIINLRVKYVIQSENNKINK